MPIFPGCTTPTDYHTAFKLGLEVRGGGLIGGLVGNALWFALGFAGTLIFAIALVLLFGIFLFGMTPHMFVVYIITGFREWRAGLSDRMSDAQAEREALIQDAQVLRDELQVAAEAAEQAGKDANSANSKLDQLNQKLEEAAKAVPAAEEVKEKDVKIYTKEAKAPVLKKEGVNEESALDKKEEGTKKTLKKF